MHAVAVVLDFVLPLVARRRFLNEARELRLDPFGWSRSRSHKSYCSTLREMRKAAFGNSLRPRPLLVHLENGGNNGSRRFVVVIGNSHSDFIAHVGVRLAPLTKEGPAKCRAFSVQ